MPRPVLRRSSRFRHDRCDDTDRSDRHRHVREDEHRLFAFTLERIVFFSDAVFAIAITLLAIELRLPDLPPGQTDASFLAALGNLGPSIFAFVVSFVVIAAFWVGHYRTFRYIVDADGRLVAINFGLLFCIAILPFPTSIIASQGDLASAAIVYAVFGVATGTFSTLAVGLPGTDRPPGLSVGHPADRPLRHLPRSGHPDRLRGLDPGRAPVADPRLGDAGSCRCRSRHSSRADFKAAGLLGRGASQPS